MRRIEIWNDEIEKDFKNFKWKKEDDGFVYSSLMNLRYYKTKYSYLKIRPFIMVYTPSIASSFTENWIAFDLLIEADDLRHEDYFEKTYDLIEVLVFEMFKEFRQTGIYFTDEAQDGQDFEGLRTNNSLKLWQFDYALVPLTLKHIYKDIPSSHKGIERDNCLVFYDKDRWKKSPAHNIV